MVSKSEKIQATKAWFECFLLQFLINFCFHTCYDAATGKPIVWPNLLVKPLLIAVIAVCLIALYTWHRWRKKFREWEGMYPEQAAEWRKQNAMAGKSRP